MKLHLESNDKHRPSDTTAQYDDCFEILSNHRRRYLLYYLKQNSGSANLSEVAEQIAAWENEINIEEVTYNQRKRVYTSLQQVHLPRMDKMGIVEFDDTSGVIKTGPVAAELDAYLEAVRNHNIPWGIFYFGLALLNLGMIGVVSLIEPVAGISTRVWLAIFCVMTFLIASTVHILLLHSSIPFRNEHKSPELAD